VEDESSDDEVDEGKGKRGFV